MALYTNLKISGPKNSELEITAEITAEVVKEYEQAVLDATRADFDLPGFRKGKVPEDIFKKHINEYHVFEDAAKEALHDAYGEIVKDNAIHTLGMPEITITKIAPGNPVEFKIRIGVVPEFSLPNYKKLAQQVKLDIVPNTSDEEIEKVVGELQSMLALQSSKSDEGMKLESPDKDAAKPELTDDFVKKLGKFENVADFKNKLKDNMRTEKEFDAKKKHREAMVAVIVKDTKITIPESVITQELAGFKEKVESDLKDDGKTLAEYLEKIKKTEVELMQEERKYIETQLKTKFVLDKIAAEENITASEQEITHEMQALAERRPDIKSDSAHYYAETILKTEKVLELLEGLAAKT